jgi:hypothetical protein
MPATLDLRPSSAPNCPRSTTFFRPSRPSRVMGHAGVCAVVKARQVRLVRKWTVKVEFQATTRLGRSRECAH